MSSSLWRASRCWARRRGGAIDGKRVVGWSGAGIGRVPVGTWFDHEVNHVAVFDAVFFEEFVICKGFSFEQESLHVCRRCRCVGAGELGFDGADGVRGVDGKSVRRGRLDRFESDAYGWHRQ